MDNLNRVAHHEAAHACCALLLGKSYGCAVYDGGAGGGLAGPGDLSTRAVCTDYTPERLESAFTGDDFQSILNDATVTAAGVVGEAIARGEDMRHVFLRGPDRALVDAGAVTVLGQGASLAVIQAWHGLAIARAHALLAPNWHRVRRIAAALALRGRLSACEVASVFHGASVTDEAALPQTFTMV